MRRSAGITPTLGNVIPFPVRTAKHRDEIRYLNDWRDQIYSNYPAMTCLSKSMADVILERIAADLRALGVTEGGRAA